MGANYPPPPIASMVSSFTGSLQTLGIIFIFFGERIFQFTGQEKPAWYEWIRSNSMLTVVSLFFLNSLAQNLRNTGAFEVELNGKTVFSKLEAGRFPNIEELILSFRRMGLKRISPEMLDEF